MERSALEVMLAEGLSVEQIGARVGRDASTVAYWVRKHGLRPVNAAKHAPRGAIDADELRQAVAAGLSIAELAETFDRSKGTVRHWLRRYGLRTLNRVGSAKREPVEPGQKGPIVARCDRHGLVEFVSEGPHRIRCARCRMDYVNRRRRTVKETLVAEAGGRCLICGYDRSPAALQFHHLNPSQKKFHISQRCLAIDTLREEVRKCVLLCANCHAEVEAGLISAPAAGHVPTSARPLPHVAADGRSSIL